MTDVFQPALMFTMFSFLTATMAFEMRPALHVLGAGLLSVLLFSDLFWPIRVFVPSTIGDPVSKVLSAATIVVLLIYLVILCRRRPWA